MEAKLSENGSRPNLQSLDISGFEACQIFLKTYKSYKSYKHRRRCR